jgi:50S ribosome-binding GTPase
MTEGQDAAAAPMPWKGVSQAAPAAADQAYAGAGVTAPEITHTELSAPTSVGTRGPAGTPLEAVPGEAGPQRATEPWQITEPPPRAASPGPSPPIPARQGGTGWPGTDVGVPTAEPRGAAPGAPGWPTAEPGTALREVGQPETRQPETRQHKARQREAGQPEPESGGPGQPRSGGGSARRVARARGPRQAAADPRQQGATGSAEQPGPGADAADDEPFARVDARKLEAALLGLRHPIVTMPLELEAPGVAEARAERVKLLSQIDDYLLPRLRQSGAPILVALVGSTGAGKSTLLNSVAAKQVSATGIRRPTTNSPVLACHPDDMRWFAENVFLPTLPRVRQQGLAMPGRDGLLVLAASEGMPQGVALLDTPDIDSVVQAHQDFAHQFLDASDLWLFVTTARRYADAAVWEMLKDARDRGAALAIALSRVPQAAAQELAEHFDAMLEANGLRDVRRFIIPETVVTDARLPAEVAAPVRHWLADTARREDRRVAVLTQTMSGVLDTFKDRVPALADQVTEQLTLRQQLRAAVDAAYAASLAEFDEAAANGSLLSGEVLARWQDFAGTGDLLRILQVRRGRGGKQKKQRMPARAAALKEALQASLESLVGATADRAAEQVVASWQRHPAGAGLLAGIAAVSGRRVGGGAAPSEADFVTTALADLGLADQASYPADADGPAALARATTGLAATSTRAIRNWLEHVLHLVRKENVTKRSIARVVSFDEESLALALTIGILGYPAADSEERDGAGPPPQLLLSSLFGAGLLRDMGIRVRTDLRDRVRLLLEEEAQRYFAIIDSVGVPNDTAASELLRAGFTLEGAR